MPVLALLFSCSSPALDPGDAVENVGGPPAAGDTSVRSTGDAPGTEHTDDGAALLFAEGTIHAIDIGLDATNWNATMADWTAVVHATLTIDGEVLDVGMHRKGSSTMRGLDHKAAFSIDIGQWVPDQTWHGVRHLSLNNMVLDPTMLREHAAAWMYAQLGIPAARHGYARVSVNGVPYGLYGIVESMDQRFLHEHWKDDEDGWLYDSIWNLGDVTPAAVANFDVAEDGATGTAFEDLHQLAATVAGTPMSGALALLQARFDAEEFLLGQATEIVLGNYDAYWFNRNNYLLYHAPVSDRWHMLPWGPDQAFLGNGSVHDPYVGQLDLLCRGDPACMAILDDDMRRVAHAMIDLDLAGYVESTWKLIEQDCKHDPRAEMPCDNSSIYTFVAERPKSVLSQLGE